MAERFFLPFTRGGPFEKQACLSFLLRSSEKKVVDTLFAILKDSAADPSLRDSIYVSIAHTGRSDILRWLKKNRKSARKLASLNREMSNVLDYDHDGIPDAFDVNPYVAPRRLTDAEQAMQVAFEAETHFRQESGCPAHVSFPPSVRPIELYGWGGPIIPASFAAPQNFKVGSQGLHRFERFMFSGRPVIHVQGGRRRATLELTVVSGPLRGGVDRIELRKIRGTWFTVSRRATIAF